MPITVLVYFKDEKPLSGCCLRGRPVCRNLFGPVEIVVAGEVVETPSNAYDAPVLAVELTRLEDGNGGESGLRSHVRPFDRSSLAVRCLD